MSGANFGGRDPTPVGLPPTPTVHIHAPRPTNEWASSGQNCVARARDGRRCGGRRMVFTRTPWYGIEVTCYHCGARYGDDGVQTPGRANVDRVRAKWIALFEAGEVVT